MSRPNVQAEDDPIAPEAGIPYKQVEANEKCILLVTPAGGHLGWVSGPQAPLGEQAVTPLCAKLSTLDDDTGDHVTPRAMCKRNETVQKGDRQIL